MNRHHTPMTLEQGVSSLELLCSLLLGSLVALTALASVRTAVFSNRQLASEEAVEKTFSVAQSRIHAAFSSTQKSPFFSLFGITGSADEHRVLTSVTLSPKPKPGSSILSAMEVDPHSILRVESEQDIGGSKELVLCSTALGIPKAATYWVTLSLDGILLTEGLLARLSKKTHLCSLTANYQGTFSVGSALPMPNNSSFNSPANPQAILSAANAFIAVSDYYAVYLDGNNTLRRRSYLTKENQPLLYNVEQFSLQIVPATETLQQIQITLTASHQQSGRTLERVFFFVPNIQHPKSYVHLIP